MIAIPKGEFMMGSPESQAGRNADESPTHSVQIPPFWMGKHEVTWDEFELFVDPRMERQVAERLNYDILENNQVDGVSRPTPPFVDMSFGMGKKGYPAVNMTHYAALAYCRWLTAKTGDFYRLPTEEEWEYACRAGNQSAYHFGNDVAKLEEYAWYFKNSKNQYQQVGTKKPNAWGLHDMHGNVAEWVMDQYHADYYQHKGENTPRWAGTTQTYPHVVRGGSWDDDPEALRSAARAKSDESWKQRDPQIPKSDWWLTDASHVGFRIVRPLKKPSKEEMDAYFYEAIKDF
jgi:formylglycine-generating enzyme required for sulfatase activity